MNKRFLPPIALAIIALIVVRILDSETPIGGTIMVMCVGAGIGLFISSKIYKAD